MANSDIVSICVDYISRIYRLGFLSFWLYLFYISVLVPIHYLFIDSLTIAVKIRNPVTSSQRCFRSLSEIRIPPRALHRSWPVSLSLVSLSLVSLSLVSLSLDFHSFAFLYFAFILSVYSCFSFYTICLFFYHAPISWVLVLLSTCVSFSPCRGAL